MHTLSEMMSKNHERVYFGYDKASGLKAIIAVHSTVLGPALGGTRMWDYSSEELALQDVLRLSRGMTYKAAMAGLALGGGKAVIIGDSTKDKTDDMMRAFGRMVEELDGKYITAEDVGTTEHDMSVIYSQTRHVTGIPKSLGGSGDPSPVTARGVYQGIRACVKESMRVTSLDGLRVAVQGIGNVGWYLCGYLHARGVKLFITDINEYRLQAAVKQFGATAVGPDEIYDADVDVFAPCALGAVLNDNTVSRIRARIVAGGANNQLAPDLADDALMRRGILYAPDYVINAGGLISASSEKLNHSNREVLEKTDNIYYTLERIFESSAVEGVPTHIMSDRLAERRIQGAV